MCNVDICLIFCFFVCCFFPTKYSDLEEKHPADKNIDQLRFVVKLYLRRMMKKSSLFVQVNFK